MKYKINHQDIKDWLKAYNGELFDGVLCDPPYHLVSMTKRWGGKNVKNTPTMDTKEGGVFARSAKGFMGKDWDGVDDNGIGIAQDPDMWRGIYDLLKPGAHLLAFSGSRTYHRMAVAIEDAGFEIRDQLIWLYGSGFPKSLNIGKAVDKIQGNEREEVGEQSGARNGNGNNNDYGTYGSADDGKFTLTKGTSEWEGYGTALKPAHEPCVLARKPIEGTVANNVLKHGTGGLNIDGARVKLAGEWDKSTMGTFRKAYDNPDKTYDGTKGNVKFGGTKLRADRDVVAELGRFPANLIHDGSDEVKALFPQTGKGNGGKPFSYSGREYNNKDSSMFNGDKPQAPSNYNDSGSASRYFYTAKASKKERNAGLEGFDTKEKRYMATANGTGETSKGMDRFTTEPAANHHPTVKPLALTKYLATLIKPPTGGRLLVPFSGSGSEMIGALQAGWEYVEGVELEEEYIPIAEARIKYWTSKPKQASLDV